MEQTNGTKIAEIFDELADIYETLDAGLSTLAVLKRGTESSDMARALELVGDYMRGSAEDMRSLAGIGKRSVVLSGN